MFLLPEKRLRYHCTETKRITRPQPLRFQTNPTMAPIHHLLARSTSTDSSSSPPTIWIFAVVIIGILVGLAVLSCCVRASRVKSTPITPSRPYNDGGIYSGGATTTAERSRIAKEHNRNHNLALYAGTDAAMVPPPPAYTPGGYTGDGGAAAVPSYAAATSSGETSSGGVGGGGGGVA